MRPVTIPPLLLLIAACNEAPDGLQIALSPENPTTTDTLEVSFTSEASDKNDDPISYSYTWSVDGEPSSEATESVSSVRTKKHQTWEVTVVASDEKLPGVAQSATVTILNTPPSADLSLSLSNPTTNDSVQVFADTEDADLDAVEMRYEWSLEGEATEITGYILGAADTEKGQQWEVTGIPNDGDEDGPAVSLQFTIGNTPPDFAAAIISPKPVTKNDTVTCIGEDWFDEDGDPETYLTAWFINGDLVGEESSQSLNDYTRGDQVYCTLTAFDGLEEGNTERSETLTIQNASPVVDSVIIGPEDPINGTLIEAEITGITDVDGDEVDLDYVWLVNGKDVSHRSYLIGDDLVRGQTVQLEITPSDPSTMGSPVLSNTLNVVNTPPIVLTLDLSPTAPTTNTSIKAQTTTTDPDKDTIDLSYAWFVNGLAVSETSDTLDGAIDFEKEDTVYVIVTPSDTEDGTPKTSATVTIANTPPLAPELVFTPSAPTSSEDLVCEVDFQEPDEDGDVITYTVEWQLNGVAFTTASTTTLTGDTILAEDREEDDLWVCSITPDDGDDLGPAGWATLGLVDPLGLDFSGATVRKSTPQGGTYAGTNYDDACGAGEVLVGFSGELTASPYIASAATRCAPMNFSCVGTSCTASTGTITTGPARGGTGTPYLRDCPSGYGVTGFVSRAGWYMDQILLRCAPLTAEFSGTEWEVSLGTSKDIAPVGGTGGSSKPRSDCASGTIATSAQLKASSTLVMTIGFGCQEPAAEEGP
jgi:hypothetical protein